MKVLASACALFLAWTTPSAAQPRPAASGPAPIVAGQSIRLSSRPLGEQRTINVWLPPSYGQGDRRYPVVYLIDGGVSQDFFHIIGLAHLGAISWSTQEMIVVGIETVDRRRELAFPVQRDPALHLRYPTAGASSDFRRFVVDEVKPFVERSYRTNGEDGLLGESLAGLFIVEAFLREPAAFDTYMAMDPSLWWDDGRLAEEAPALLARGGTNPRRLWLSVGKETLEQPQYSDRLVAALRAGPASVTFRYEPRPALTHATIYHPTAWEALQAFYPRPPE